MSAIEAALFDLDKTLIDERGCLYPGLAVPLDLAVRPRATTFITGRGYPRYTQAAEQNPVLWAPGLPVGLENGGRIVDGTTFENKYFCPLSVDERGLAFDYLENASDIRFVSFHPRQARAKATIWPPDTAEAAYMTTAYARNARVCMGSLATLFAAIEAADPCMITCKTWDAPLTHPDPALHTLQNGTTRNIVPAAAHKGTAGLIIADMLGLDLQRTLAAGDESADVPLLTLPDLGYPVAVGAHLQRYHRAELPPATLYVDHPAHLGALLTDILEVS